MKFIVHPDQIPRVIHGNLIVYRNTTSIIVEFDNHNIKTGVYLTHWVVFVQSSVIGEYSPLTRTCCIVSMKGENLWRRGETFGEYQHVVVIVHERRKPLETRRKPLESTNMWWLYMKGGKPLETRRKPLESTNICYPTQSQWSQWEQSYSDGQRKDETLSIVLDYSNSYDELYIIINEMVTTRTMGTTMCEKHT